MAAWASDLAAPGSYRVGPEQTTSKILRRKRQRGGSVRRSFFASSHATSPKHPTRLRLKVLFATLSVSFDEPNIAPTQPTICMAKFATFGFGQALFSDSLYDPLTGDDNDISSAGKRKRQPGALFVLRTAHNATPTPNLLAFGSIVCKFVWRAEGSAILRLQTTCNTKLATQNATQAPKLACGSFVCNFASARVSASRRSSAPASKILGQQMTALTSSTCQQTIVI